MNSDEVALNR